MPCSRPAATPALCKRPVVLITTVHMDDIGVGNAWPLLKFDRGTSAAAFASAGNWTDVAEEHWASCMYAGDCIAKATPYTPESAGVHPDAPASVVSAIGRHHMMWFDAGDGVIGIACEGAGTMDPVPNASTIYLWLQHQYGFDIRRLAAFRRLVLAAAAELSPGSPVCWLECELQRIASFITVAGSSPAANRFATQGFRWHL